MNEVTFVPSPTAVPLAPRLSASVILLRDGAHGLELLLLRRAAGASFMAGAFVFPGGTVDPHEHALGALPGARHAAVRECFEECALLLADGPSGQPLVLDNAAVAERFAAHRMRLLQGDSSWGELCVAEGLRPWTDALVHVAHWITPIGAPKRFETHFFLAPAPSGQQALHDGREVTEHLWIRPHDALARQRAGELMLVTVTRTIVASLTEVDSVAEALARARRQPAPEPVTPRVATNAQGLHVVVPAHPAYAEIGRLDPLGSGAHRSIIVPGDVVQLSERVRRLTAPNPGVMTGPGTNTYLLDAGEEGTVVIDPGPDDSTHVERILAATNGRIRAVLVTHDHLDHRPAAVRLQAETGADWVALPRTGREPSEPRQHVPADGELLRYGPLVLQALHTPGHASSHLCFLLPEERLLFSGDHVMQGSTVVIAPPDGDLRVYLESLRRLIDLPIDWIAPGHGFLMDRPAQVLESLVAHRLQREARVVAALDRETSRSLEALLADVYRETPVVLHEAAGRMLHAHLLKLEAEGRAVSDDDGWRLVSN